MKPVQEERRSRVRSASKIGGMVTILLGFFLSLFALFPWRLDSGLVSSETEFRIPVDANGNGEVEFQVANNTLRAIALKGPAGCSCLNITFRNSILYPLQSTQCILAVDARGRIGQWIDSAISVDSGSTQLPIRFLTYLQTDATKQETNNEKN
jgi:hypothetical protein